MKKARDYQVSAVYKSEDHAFNKRKEPEFETLDQCAEFAEKIIASEYWLSQKGLKRFNLHDGRGRRSACSKGRKGKTGADIYCLPKWSRSRWVIIHEFAHGLTDRTHQGAAWHGSIFCKHYLMLIKELLNHEHYEMLIGKFDENKVRYIQH